LQKKLATPDDFDFSKVRSGTGSGLDQYEESSSGSYSTEREEHQQPLISVEELEDYDLKKAD